MATLTLALDRCYGSLCRAFLGHAADPRHEPEHRRERRGIVPRPDSASSTRLVAIPTVLSRGGLRSALRGERSSHSSMTKKSFCPFDQPLPRNAWNSRLRVGITLYRSTAGGALESARQRALPLHLKHTNCDGYPNGRACQLQRVVLRHAIAASGSIAPLTRRSLPVTVNTSNTNAEPPPATPPIDLLDHDQTIPSLACGLEGEGQDIARFGSVPRLRGVVAKQEILRASGTTNLKVTR